MVERNDVISSHQQAIIGAYRRFELLLAACLEDCGNQPVDIGIGDAGIVLAALPIFRGTAPAAILLNSRRKRGGEGFDDHIVVKGNGAALILRIVDGADRGGDAKRLKRALIGNRQLFLIRRLGHDLEGQGLARGIDHLAVANRIAALLEEIDSFPQHGPVSTGAIRYG